MGSRTTWCPQFSVCSLFCILGCDPEYCFPLCPYVSCPAFQALGGISPHGPSPPGVEVMSCMGLFGGCLPLANEHLVHKSVCGPHSSPSRKAVPLLAPPRGIEKEPPLASHHEINWYGALSVPDTLLGAWHMRPHMLPGQALFSFCTGGNWVLKCCGQSPQVTHLGTGYKHTSLAPEHLPSCCTTLVQSWHLPPHATTQNFQVWELRPEFHGT